MKSLGRWYSSKVIVIITSSFNVLIALPNVLHCLLRRYKRRLEMPSFYSTFSIHWTQVRIQNFYFSILTGKEKKIDWEDKLSLDKSENKCKETDSSILDSNCDGEIV